MVITGSIPRRGWLQMDLAISMAILLVALMPIVYSVTQERQICRSLYYRSIAMSIVDGELEVLRAGQWRRFAPGEHDYFVTAEAAAQLPKGRFSLSRTDNRLRLEWIPEKPATGGKVVRECILPGSS